MDEILSYNIEIIPLAYPSYPPNIILTNTGSQYVKFHTRITFSDGTIINNYSGDWIYNNKHFNSLENILDLLPQKVQDVIIFNLEEFRKI